MSEDDAQLETVFGGPSDDAFGSAVFRTALSRGDDLETVARDTYRVFTGELWDRYGAETWLATFSELASRRSPEAGSVLMLLRALEDPASRSAAEMLVDANPDAHAAQTALVEAFDHDGISELKVFSIGDSGAMSGLMIAARNDKNARAVLLVFQMD